MQQRLQTTSERNTSIKVKHYRGRNAPGLASLVGTQAVIRALRKFLNVLAVGFGHLLRLHLELLFWLLRYYDWILCLRSYMMYVRKCLRKRCIR
jgi:hypothetical protein